MSEFTGPEGGDVPQEVRKRFNVPERVQMCDVHDCPFSRLGTDQDQCLSF